MSKYKVRYSNGDLDFTFKATYYTISDGFVTFCCLNEISGKHDRVASYATKTIHSVEEQDHE